MRVLVRCKLSINNKFRTQDILFGIIFPPSMTIMVVVPCAGVNQIDNISENFCNNRRGTRQSRLDKFIRMGDNGVKHTGNSGNEM